MTLFESVFAGNDAVYGLTEGAINQAIEKYGADKAVSFPDTAYSLPCYYAVTGTKVGTLAELKDALAVVKTLMTREKRTNDVFMSGVATALCAEFIEVLKYIDGAVPYEAPCYGHLADAVIRELGVPLVTGDIPGVAVILGKAPSAQEAADLVKSYQSQGILITLVGDVIDQLEEVGYKTGANVRVIPLGKDVTAVIHVVSVALRAALIFGNVKPGDAATLMDYTMKRVPAFVNAFAPLNDVIVACGAGAIALGFPVITNQEDVARVPKSLICQKDISKWNAVYIRPWTGESAEMYSGAGEYGQSGQVYVAENGSVYHRDLSCTYLALSIHACSMSSVQHLRNQYGARYVQCERCGHVSDKNQTVFITDMGTAWHTDRHCSGLKRTMDGMSQKEAEQSGLRPCSRCGVSGGGDA